MLSDAPGRKRTAEMALAALSCGLCSIVLIGVPFRFEMLSAPFIAAMSVGLVTAVAAMALGAASRIRIREHAGFRGRWIAVAGSMSGMVATVWWGFFIMAAAFDLY